MTITKLTLTDDDLKEAVQDFLAKRGITIRIESILREYSWQDTEVFFKEPEKRKAMPTLPELKPTEVALALVPPEDTGVPGTEVAS